MYNIKELKEPYRDLNRDAKPKRVTRMAGQMWDFAKEIKRGYVVALPLKSQSSIALGSVEGDYRFEEVAPDIKHIRPVKWLSIIPRSEFDQDLLFSLGARCTVCEIKRNNAEERIRKIFKHQIDAWHCTLC